MTVRPTVVTFAWDKVAGATGYDIVRDGLKVASTRTALKTQVKVLQGGHVFEVHAKGVSPDVQRLDMRYEEPPDPSGGPVLSARSSIQAGDSLSAGSAVDWSVSCSVPADSCEWFVDGASIGVADGPARVFHFGWRVSRAATVGFEVKLGAQSAGVRSFPVKVA